MAQMLWLVSDEYADLCFGFEPTGNLHMLKIGIRNLHHLLTKYTIEDTDEILSPPL